MIEKKITGYPSIDRPWLKYYREGVQESTIPQKTIYRYILDNNKTYFQDIAIIYFGYKISYEKLFRMTDRIANILTAQGLGKGNSILLCSTQTPETLYLILACSKLGICLVMLNPTLGAEQLERIIRESDAQWFFCLDKLYGVIEESLKKHEIANTIIIPATASLPGVIRFVDGIKGRHRGKNKNICMWSRFLKWKEIECGEESGEADGDLVVVFSSGTTGEAKGIIHTNKSYVSMAVQYQNNGYPFERGDTFLNQLPAFIAAGLSYPLLAPLAFGVKIILEPVYQESVLVKDLVKYKPNIVAATKSFWFAAAKDKNMTRNALENLKIPVSGGEAINEQDTKALNGFSREYGCLHEMYFGYGMSELNGTAVTTPVQGYSPGSIGIPLPAVVVAAFDADNMKECTYGEYGEIMIQTPCCMKEYYHNAELTHNFFWKDGDGNTWCKTGDVGYINENGEVYVLGRVADSMRTKSGKRLYFFEVETAVQEEATVAQCKVVYLEENDEWLVILVLHIALEEDELHLRLDELCKDVLGENQTIRYKVWDAFPLTPNGKCDVRAMKSIAKFQRPSENKK